jgi:glycosyltransferase involved in cell wall biosynthesis
MTSLAVKPRNQNENKMKILLISENVPPQVNGIARRIGHYKEGLVNLGHKVDFLHPEVGLDKVIPHVNPWNFTARMMIIVPKHFYQILNTEYDIVHCVLPLNLSGMWLLAAFKAIRTFRKESKPSLVVSWHCNMVNYVEHHSPAICLWLAL